MSGGGLKESSLNTKTNYDTYLNTKINYDSQLNNIICSFLFLEPHLGGGLKESKLSKCRKRKQNKLGGLEESKLSKCRKRKKINSYEYSKKKKIH